MNDSEDSSESDDSYSFYNHYDCYENKKFKLRKNSKYEDVFVFKETKETIKKNAKDWKRWNIRLRNKIWICFNDFFTKIYKINYVRDHFFDRVYKVIKIRTKSNAREFYKILQELLDDLNIVFDERDFENNVFNEFYNKKFYIKNDEFFEKFYLRFQAVLSKIYFFEKIIVNHFRRFINKKFKNNLRQMIECENLNEFIRAVKRQAKHNVNANKWNVANKIHFFSRTINKNVIVIKKFAAIIEIIIFENF